MKKIFSLTGILIILSVIFLAIGIPKLIEHHNKYEKYIPIDAVIVDYKENWNYDDYNEPTTCTYAPIVEYEVDGVVYSATYSVYSSFPPAIGETMAVRYNIDDPSDAIFETESSHLWLIAIGIICAVGAVVLMVVKKRKKEQTYEEY